MKKSVGLKRHGQPTPAIQEASTYATPGIDRKAGNGSPSKQERQGYILEGTTTTHFDTRKPHPDNPPPNATDNARSLPLQTISRTHEFQRSDTPLRHEDGVTLLQSSAGLGWSGIYAQLTAETPHDTAYGETAHTWFILPTEPVRLWRRTGHRRDQGLLIPDRLVLTAAGDSVCTIINNDTAALHVFVKTAVFDEVAHELFAAPPDRPAPVASAFGIEDRALSLLLRSVKQALHDPPEIARLKGDWLARVIVAHTLGNAVPGQCARVPNDPSRLGVQQMRAVIEYLEDNLNTELRRDDLAGTANLGRTTFLRQFKTTTGQTPHQYVMAARVRKACGLLRQTGLPVSEIALACGFSDQAHLSTLFKRLVGVTPTEYRRESN